MQSIVVIDQLKSCPLDLTGVPVISARDYLAGRGVPSARRLRVFNLCKSYRYQSLGYYVSLLALARGHTPLPSIATVQDMRSASLSRLIADELTPNANRLLKRLKSDEFVLSVYFGRNLAQQYDELSGRIFRLFHAPFIRARFKRDGDGWWFRSLRPIALNDIPASHRAFAAEAARGFFERNRMPQRSRQTSRYDLAILTNAEEAAQDRAPSDEKALRRIEKAARRHDAFTERITRDDYGRIAEFDALFIRETTQVDRHTYRFARRAAAEGLVVIDDPESIIKCTNKVFLAELLERQRIPIPQTRIVSRDSRNGVAADVTYPVIVKQPDSAFSQGVFKAESAEALEALLTKLFADSELIVLQEFMKTAFDWRIGVLDRELLYACKYHMAKSHWQIANNEAAKTTYGDVEAVALEDVPPAVLKVGLRAATAIGDGLYGVDVKQVGKRAVVIEVNDNPNLDGGCEDAILGDAIYDRIIQTFVRRIEQRRGLLEIHS